MVSVLPRHAGGWAQLRAARSRRANGARAIERGWSLPGCSDGRSAHSARGDAARKKGGDVDPRGRRRRRPSSQPARRSAPPPRRPPLVMAGDAGSAALSTHTSVLLSPRREPRETRTVVALPRWLGVPQRSPNPRSTPGLAQKERGMRKVPQGWEGRHPSSNLGYAVKPLPNAKSRTRTTLN